MRFFLLLISCGLLFSCVEEIPLEVLRDAPEAELVKEEKIMSPEQRELENKLAARALLQKVVDGSTTFKKEELMYECSTNTGGLLTLLKDGAKLKGLRFATSTQQANEFMSLYYNNDKLLFIVHERGEWRGDFEKTTQTLFYLDDETVFHCLRKFAKGESSTIEQQINNAEFEIISTDQQLLNQIIEDEKLLRQQINTSKLREYFCK